MFDIKIGTLISGESAEEAIPMLNEKGFESYELDMNHFLATQRDNFPAWCEKIAKIKGEAIISSFGIYGNTLKDELLYSNICYLIENAKLLNVSVIGMFAGADPECTVPNTIPLFKEKFSKLVELAEKNDVKLAIEGCGGGWNGGGNWNIGFCDDSWELMFDAVNSDYLGLEWEPCHAMERFQDPIIQLRRWAKKVYHIHGKDATIAWDELHNYGIGCSHGLVWNRTPGFGDTNWSDVFTILIMNGFEGACDIEGYHDPVHYDDMEWTAQLTGLEYLKRCRGGIDYYFGPANSRGYQGKRKK